MNIKSRFSSEILNARKRMGLTQDDAAEKLNISKRWFQKIEKEEQLPSALLVLKIIELFEIDGKNLKER